jgi:hypothetical protein
MEASWRGKPQNPVAKWDRSHMIWMMKICWWNIDRGVQTIQQQRLWESAKTTCELEKFSTSPSYVHPKSKPLFLGGGKTHPVKTRCLVPKPLGRLMELIPIKLWFWNNKSVRGCQPQSVGSPETNSHFPQKISTSWFPQKNCLFTWSVGPSPVRKPQKISHTLW